MHKERLSRFKPLCFRQSSLIPPMTLHRQFTRMSYFDLRKGVIFIFIQAYLLFFFLCSFLGWVMEVCVKLVQHGRFINRGFLIGPYCPIYGVGCVLMAWLLPQYAESIPATFALAMLVCGVVEYVTSWAMEKLFQARWWDYSTKRFQLNGRVCLQNLLAFGVMGVAVVKLLAPWMLGLLSKLPIGLMNGLCIGLSVLFVADVAVSVNVLGRIRSVAANVKGDSTEVITRAVHERLMQRGLLLRRALHAFPDARLYNRRLLEQLRNNRRELTRRAHERNIRFRQELEQMEKRLHQ